MPTDKVQTPPWVSQVFRHLVPAILSRLCSPSTSPTHRRGPSAPSPDHSPSSARPCTFLPPGPCSSSHSQLENHFSIIISQTISILKMQLDCVLPNQPGDPWAQRTGDVFPRGSQRLAVFAQMMLVAGKCELLDSATEDCEMLL